MPLNKATELMEVAHRDSLEMRSNSNSASPSVHEIEKKKKSHGEKNT